MQDRILTGTFTLLTYIWSNWLQEVVVPAYEAVCHSQYLFLVRVKQKNHDFWQIRKFMHMHALSLHTHLTYPRWTTALPQVPFTIPSIYLNKPFSSPIKFCWKSDELQSAGLSCVICASICTATHHGDAYTRIIFDQSKIIMISPLTSLTNKAKCRCRPHPRRSDSFCIPAQSIFLFL